MKIGRTWNLRNTFQPRKMNLDCSQIPGPGQANDGERGKGGVELQEWKGESIDAAVHQNLRNWPQDIVSRELCKCKRAGLWSGVRLKLELLHERRFGSYCGMICPGSL